MLEQLLNCKPYSDENRPPRGEHGLYLFSEKDVHLYVGRTGITARARAGVTESGTSFRGRFDNHTQDGTPPGTAPCANRLMREEAAASGLEIPEGWWEMRKGDTEVVFALFKNQKERIRAMECRIVAFLDDERGVRSTVAETYVHAVLRTPYNEFLTS